MPCHPAGYQNAPGQFNPQGSPGQFGYQPPFDYRADQGQPGNQSAPGSFNYQVSQGQPGYQGFPGQFGPGQAGYQGTPTPIGYQDPQFGQPGYGSRMWSAGGASGPGLGGGFGRVLLGILAGPGAFRRPGRNRYFWYIRIAFWLIVIGIILYVGFTTHTLIGNCAGGCGG